MLSFIKGGVMDVVVVNVSHA